MSNTFKEAVLSNLSLINITPDRDQFKAIDSVSVLLKKRWFFSRSPYSGVYIWGFPGRGKSVVMDACFKSYNGRKVRMHLHEFFKHIVALSADKISQDNNQSYDLILDKWISSFDLICFDEFHVHDIGDTMLIMNFLRKAVSQNKKLILTSNYEPSQLQAEPLFHERFLPAIKIIKDKFDVIPFTIEHDYRKNSIDSKINDILFFHPLSSSKHKDVLNILMNDDPSFKVIDTEVKLSGRPFKAFAKGDYAIGFTYEDLCVAPSSYIDYIELTDKWRTLFLSGITDDHLYQRHSMQRFIWLLDVLYDRKILFYTTSERPLIEMIEQNLGFRDLDRTISRLYEMQYFQAK